MQSQQHVRIRTCNIQPPVTNRVQHANGFGDDHQRAVAVLYGDEQHYVEKLR